MLAVRAFVTAHDVASAASITVDKDVVLVDVTHSNLQQRHVEIRLHKTSTVDQLRVKIHQQTGTPPQFQDLQLYHYNDLSSSSNHHQQQQQQHHSPPRFEIPAQSSSYEQYPIGYFIADQRGWLVHCVDTNPQSLSARGGLEDVSLVPKFRLSEAQYDAKTQHTLRAWKRQQQAVDPSFTLQKHAAAHAALHAAVAGHRRGQPLPNGYQLDRDGRVVAKVAATTSTPIKNTMTSLGPDTVEHVIVGDRCQITAGRRRGVVAWKGEIASLGSGGYWVGVRLDEPMGKHDGSLAGGARYFEAPSQHGTFVRGHHVECGDFPERDIMEDDDDDDNDSGYDEEL